jgi:hypothetical protein
MSYGESDEQMKVEDFNSLYGGPRSGGQSADDYSDLHDSGANPFAASSPAVNGTADTGKGFRVGSTAPLGYYTNPTARTDNANNDGAGVFRPGEQGCADNIAAGFDAVYADVLRSRQPSAPDPGASGIYTDEGYGPIGTGRS